VSNLRPLGQFARIAPEADLREEANSFFEYVPLALGSRQAPVTHDHDV
jgi:hypothetical protein